MKMGVARQTLLAPSIIFVFEVEITNIYEVKLNIMS